MVRTFCYADAELPLMEIELVIVVVASLYEVIYVWDYVSMGCPLG